jgi:hypothetical protein
MADSTKKVPGMLQDPWRSAQVPAPTKARPTKQSPEPENSVGDTDDESEHSPLATIDLKGYGAITVGNASTSMSAAARILGFTVNNRKDLEKIFTDFGVVIAQMPLRGSEKLKFYIQRADGWILAIPGAMTRDAGCLQLIQALLHLNTVPSLKKKLEDAKISVYKF